MGRSSHIAFAVVLGVALLGAVAVAGVWVLASAWIQSRSIEAEEARGTPFWDTVNNLLSQASRMLLA